MDCPEACAVVDAFWRLMASNDFRAVGAVLAPEFVLEWPQSRERLRGAESFALMNEQYPAHGRWRFNVRRLIGDAATAVSEVAITDDVQHAVAISFFEVSYGRITRLVEYWPEPYAAAPNRAHLVEAMER